jgi:hypothetical protein
MPPALLRMSSSMWRALRHAQSRPWMGPNRRSR